MVVFVFLATTDGGGWGVVWDRKGVALARGKRFFANGYSNILLLDSKLGHPS